MKFHTVALLLLSASVRPEPVHFRYQRTVTATAPGQTCLPVPSEVFAHGAAGLADLRLYRGTAEIPYAVITDTPAAAALARLTPLNLGTRAGKTVFDVAVPGGTYSDVVLDVQRKDYIATVEVSGSSHADRGSETRIGQYTIFDLSGQKLGSSSVLHLPPSTFRYLHVEVRGPVKPDDITGITLGKQEQQGIPYILVAQSSAAHADSHTSTVEFTVPAHVPVDRVDLAVGPRPAEFNRTVNVSIAPGQPPSAEDADTFDHRAFSGTVLRLHRVQQEQRLDEEQLSLDTSSQSAAPARWTVAIENGDDPPLQLTAVRLEMEQRELCFDAAAAGVYALMYGDPALDQPQYDYATLFTRRQDAATALLGPEGANSRYQPRADDRPFTERHPALLWSALVLAVCLLGTIALRTGQRMGADREQT